MENVAAFFDIDGTIYREGLITEVFKKMIRHELIQADKWNMEVRPAYLLWDTRQGAYDSYLLKMVDIYTEAVIGIDPMHIEHIAKKVIEQKGDRVYTFTRDRIMWHKSQGHKVIAISGSPIELVSEMSQKYDMDDFRGTIYKTNDNNVYTGEVIPMWDAVSKKKAIMEMTEKYNIDLSQSYAYGDTAGDITMLQLVGNPFATNPTKELLNYICMYESLKEKISIIIQRKDVVYKLMADQLEHIY